MRRLVFAADYGKSNLLVLWVGKIPPRERFHELYIVCEKCGRGKPYAEAMGV